MKISIFQLATTIAEAKAVYFAAKAQLTEEQQHTHEHYNNLWRDILQLVELANTEVLKELNDYLFQTLTSLHQDTQLPGAADAFTELVNPIDDVRTNNRRFSDQECVLPTLGTFLTGIIANNVNIFKQKINDIRTNARNLSEAQQQRIDQILIELNDTSKFVHHMISLDNIDPMLTAIKHDKDLLVADLHLNAIPGLTIAFAEAVKIDETLGQHLLPAEELAHLGDVIRNHFAKKRQQMPPSLYRCLTNLSQIKMIYRADLASLEMILNGSIGGCAHYLKSHFERASAPVYSSYEGLTPAIANYRTILSIFEEILNEARAELAMPTATVAPARATQPAPSAMRKRVLECLVTSLQKYQQSFNTYFQVAMRFIMPIEQMQRWLQELQNNATLQDSPFHAEVAEASRILSIPVEILRQKTIIVNAYKDMQDYLSEIQTLMNRLQLKRPTFLATGKLDMLTELRALLCGLSESMRTEDVTNYQRIFEDLDAIFRKHKIEPNTIKDTSRSDTKKFLKKIHTRFKDQRDRFQPDHIAPTI